MWIRHYASVQRRQPAKSKKFMSSVQLLSNKRLTPNKKSSKERKKNPLDSYKLPDQFPAQPKKNPNKLIVFSEKIGN